MPMLLTSEHKQLVIFAKRAAERDFLRNALAPKNGRVICFENESICFDNLISIDPQAVLTRTDSTELVWRFIFAIRGLNLSCRLIVLSNQLNEAQFVHPRFDGCIQCIPLKNEEGQLLDKIETLICTDKPPAETVVNTDLMVGQSPAIQRINNQLPTLINASDPILITGETGTGKEYLARIITTFQKNSPVFIKIDCSLIDSTLSKENTDIIEQFKPVLSEIGNDYNLFNKSIIFFLDKIHLLEKKAQSEFLPILESGFQSTVSQIKVPYDVKLRFISTSNIGINELIKSGNFRKAFLYRLNVIPIHIPPLRQRREDLPLLIDYFIIDACKKMKRSFITLSQQVIDRLVTYEWPGNVAELQRLIQRTVMTGNESNILAHNGIRNAQKKPKALLHIIDTETFPNAFEIKNYLSDSSDWSLKNICDKIVGRTEKMILQKALETTNWNRKKAAALLHISYKSMLNKMKMYEIV